MAPSSYTPRSPQIVQETPAPVINEPHVPQTRNNPENQAVQCDVRYDCEQTFKFCISSLASAYQQLAVASPGYSLLNTAGQWIVPNLTTHASAFFLVAYHGEYRNTYNNAKIYVFEDMRRENTHMCRTVNNIPRPGWRFIQSLSVEQYRFIMRALETFGFPLGVSMDYVNARGKFIRCSACASGHDIIYMSWKEFVSTRSMPLINQRCLFARRSNTVYLIAIRVLK